MSLFRGGMFIGEGSAAPVPLWIMSPPFDYEQAENGSLEGCSSGDGHVVMRSFCNPFLHMLIFFLSKFALRGVS